MKFTVIPLLLVTVLLTAGCVNQQPLTQSIPIVSEITTLITQAPTQTPIPSLNESSDYLTYIDKQSNFQIDYPILMGEPKEVQGSSQKKVQFDSQADIRIAYNYTYTLDHWFENWENIAKEQNAQILEVYDIKVGGTRAIKQTKIFTSERGEPTVVEVHIVKNNTLYLLSFYKANGINNDTIYRMTYSFKFLN